MFNETFRRWLLFWNSEHIFLSGYNSSLIPLKDSLISFFLGISTSYGLFNADTWFTFKFSFVIIIIMSCRQHGYPWPSLAAPSYRLSPLAGLQNYISYPHIAAVCMFELVVLLLLGHMWGSIGVHHSFVIITIFSTFNYVLKLFGL